MFTNCTPHNTEEKLNFCLMLKTFKGDVLAAKRLIKSYHKYNKDSIPLFIMCPEADIPIFDAAIDDLSNITMLAEELLKEHLVTEPFTYYGHTEPTRPGYVNQALVRLSFWELGITENYFCLDSEGEFIKDFYIKDFMYDAKTPYSILCEDNELKVDPYYYEQCQWQGREANLRNMQREIEYMPNVLLAAHGFITFNSFVLRHLRETFMHKRDIGYTGLLKISGPLAPWYCMWLQKSHVIPIVQRDPLFLTFHHELTLKRYRAEGITREDIARGYIGICVNSNFQPNRGEDGPLDYEAYENFIPLSPTFKDIVRYTFKFLARQAARDVWLKTKRTLRPYIPQAMLKMRRKILGLS